MVSGSFSLPLPGVLFTFPSQYYALSVTKEYLALRGGPRIFSQGSTCLDLLWIPPCQLAFRLRAFTLSGRLSQNRSARLIESIPRSEPQDARTLCWALPFSLAATHRISVVFSSSGYLDVSVHRVPFLTLWIGVRTTEVFSARFPHSGDLRIDGYFAPSPKLFAAYHVLHRLLVPRHPPYALISITKR